MWASISETRQAIARGPIFTGAGKRPSLMSRRRLDSLRATICNTSESLTSRSRITQIPLTVRVVALSTCMKCRETVGELNPT